MTMLSEALDYARRGWYVFPCREKPGQPYTTKEGERITPLEKTPYISGGLNNATLDEEQIVEWWKRWENALIGVNAGKSGLFVIDIDRKHVNGLEVFETWNVNDTAGLHSITPSGGIHIVFKGTGKSSTNAKTGVDTRGEGGYFIVPPSKIIEGNFVGEYKRYDDWGREPGVIPDGLMARLFPDNTVEYVRGSFNIGDNEKKLLSRNTLAFITDGALEGERNSTLFKVCADFAGCGYEKEHTKQVISPVCQRIGLSSSEVEQVLNHAYSKNRTASIPDSIQEKIKDSGKRAVTKLTVEEESIMEDAVLACLIKENSLIPVVNDILNSGDFHIFKNRMIYRAINRLNSGGMKVDYLTVSTEVASETDKITLDDVSKMMNQYDVNVENTVTYANLIRERASIRKLEALMDNKEKYLKGGNLVEITNSIEKDLADIAIYGGAKSTSVLTGEQAADMVLEQTEKIRTGEIEQLRTGFEVYDIQIGGIYSNELIICAGRAGEGKSALAMSMVNNIGIKDKVPVALFSLEMSTHECISRLICQLTGLPFRKVYQGKLKGQEWDTYMEAMGKIKESNIYFDDGFGMTVPEIRSKIRKLMDKNVKFVVIDQLEQIKGYEGQPPYIQFDKIAYDIKNMTKEFDVPILLCHQLNRNITDRKLKNPEPQLSDLNQAGEKPANQVWVIQHNRDEHGNIIQSKVKMLKNRNGAKIDFPLIYIGERMLFSNPSTEEERIVFQDRHVEDEPDEFGHRDVADDEPFWSKRS